MNLFGFNISIGNTTASPRKHSWVHWFLLGFFIGLPILEVIVFIYSAHNIGVLKTFLLMFLTSTLGLWLGKREGNTAWKGLRQASRQGRLPAVEIADAVAVSIGAILLLIPGFVSDIVGLLFLMPITRGVARNIIFYAIARKFPQATRKTTSSANDHPTVIEGEVVADDVFEGTIEDSNGRVI
ncbi:MAG: FxsA family protein [Propionibacteriaceae bacterium]